ncbi:hypothetical protein [Butyrivibrio sp. MC2021]|uniref:hypothetical protein n=1 Tax=Butyrivibrio sp. MC2021 TaxID=1408306 RepID=UPI000B262BA2|nr:hypothetical protein [Butyrivibrio sp. MC2021]
MSVRERIISLKLIKRKESHPDFLNEIGVSAELATKEKDDSRIEQEPKEAR